MKTTTRITAIPSGKTRRGGPLSARTFEVDERREDWGDGRTRIFVRRPDLDARPDQQCFAPEVVRTDSILEDTAPVHTAITAHIAAGKPLTWYDLSVLVDRRVYGSYDLKTTIRADLAAKLGVTDPEASESTEPNTRKTVL